ncbi:hypothetical protein NEOLEDRAFT_1098566 [Neolentinus lepideus HHB14362 ss-1]|uniref:G-protein coupled receptors family 1 profile domain-containing protein n=1 Tax=Neolentinus lepideus HHB14362 ss-1 TaxID=1314782 RepID=A0A165Q4Y7_9AGAM|nr:hypothetical protein NEOLEDRAFT_1098566 [Neolentinus lepideus HHB14362 ss-1]
MGEPHSQIRFDELSLLGCSTLVGAAWGIMSVIYGACVYQLSLSLSSVMFLVGTAYVVLEAYSTYLIYVVHRTYPAGPVAYNETFLFSQPLDIANSSMYVIANIMGDGLMVWRFILFYKQTWYGKWLSVLPCLLYTGFVVLSIITLAQASSSGHSLYSPAAKGFGLSCWAVSVANTLLITTLIVARIWSFRNRTKVLLGRHHSKLYVSIMTMLIESAMLYAVTMLIFVITYALQLPARYVMIDTVLTMIRQIIAPLLIIFRVSRGRAWGDETAATLYSDTEVQFSSALATLPKTEIRTLRSVQASDRTLNWASQV